MTASKKTAAAPVSNHHYFATTAFGWATAETRAKAIEAVARQAGSDIIKTNVKNNGGLYCWSCHVALPEKSNYSISNYVPERITIEGKVTEDRVPISSVLTTRIQNNKGHVIIEDVREEEK